MGTINYDFLMNQGGAVIKYRTATELKSDISVDQIQELNNELLKSKEVGKRLENLKSEAKHYDFNGVHGSTVDHLENSLPMVLDFGIRTGMGSFEETMEPIIGRLERAFFPESHVFSRFINIIIVPFLYKAGFREPWIVEFMEKRLELIYSFTCKKNYSIYDEENIYKGVPKSFRNRRIIKPEFYENGDFRFPLIYDIYGFAEMIKEGGREKSEKIGDIIEYILNPEYDELHNGYGILVREKGKYFAMGWDAKLPKDQGFTSKILQRLELMAHFEVAVESQWFKNNFEKMEKYKTQRGTYIFPKEALREKNGCWVKSNHMGLGENRRKSKALELESTFRAEKIKKILSEHKQL